MSKLTKSQAKNHQEAVEILKNDALTHDERIFVFENWQESAGHINSAAGAFFTPIDLARGLAIELPNAEIKVIDLCAGIGVLSYAIFEQSQWQASSKIAITCIEKNADYVAVGRKVLPEATWIHADVLDIPDLRLGKFNAAISNPPFGNIKRNKNASGYKGRDFEFHVVDIASRIADYGIFILPQSSSGFNYSGKNSYTRQTDGKSFYFQRDSGLLFEAGCGVDTSIFKNHWRGVSPACEIVVIDFPAPLERGLFDEVAA